VAALRFAAHYIVKCAYTQVQKFPVFKLEDKHTFMQSLH